MKKIIAIAIIILLVVFAAFRLKSNRDKIVSQKENLTTDQVTVSTADVVKESASVTMNFTGTSYPNKELDIPAEIAGKITSINFTLGQSVQKGDVIASLDDKIKKVAYSNAKIEMEKLKKDLDRTENLYKGGTTSEQQLDNARNAYETAKNKFEEAEKQLSYTKITAPMAGVIVKKIVEEGTYVNIGNPVASMVDVSKLKVKVNVSESSVYSLKTGDRVKITSDIYRGTTYEGRISFVSPRGDDAHNYPVEVEISNSGKNPLKAGTFVNVAVEIKSAGSSLLIPRAALQGSIKDAKVYVAENGKAMLKSIVVGGQIGDQLEVRSGLEEKQKVIVSGQVNLTDNKSIKIINNN